MTDSSSISSGSEFFDASDIAEISVPSLNSKDGGRVRPSLCTLILTLQDRSKSVSKKSVPPLGKLDSASLAKAAPRPAPPIPSLVLPHPTSPLDQRRSSNPALRNSGEGPPSPALTPRARLRATEGPGARRASREPSRRLTAHGHSGSDNTPRDENSLATDISIDDLASLAAEGDEEVYLTDLTTGEMYSIDQLRKKGDEGDAGLYAKGKLLLVGKGKTIKSLLQSVDTSVSTQKAKVLRRIDSLTSREEGGEIPRSPSGSGSAIAAAPAAAKGDPKAEKTSIFRKFSKDAVSVKKEREAATPAAALLQRISIMNVPVRNPAPKIVRKHKQKRKLVGAIRVLDEITVHKGAVWVLKFSHDNRLLASGGHDMILRIWKVRDSLREFRLLEPTPACTFAGHAGDILDVAWSKAQFILSSSMDKTVRLWHVTREDCLYVFNHDDFVTSVAFHPTNDRLFLTGCLDKKLRLWSIPDKAVKEWKDVGGFVTAATFTPNGRTAIAATYDGKCTFYEGETLRWITQVNADPKAKGSSGKKITGLEILPGGGKMHRLFLVAHAMRQLLITSNDSRLRLYHLSDYSLVCTYKGLTNNSYQIRASFSEDGKYVISGSEDHSTYLWDTEPQQNTWAPYINPLRTSRQDKSDAFESFDTQPDGSTLVSIFVPKALYASQIEGCDDANLDRLIVTADTFGTIKVWFTRPDAGTATPAP